MGLPELSFVAKRQRVQEECSADACTANFVIDDEPPQMRALFAQSLTIDRDAADDLFAP